VAGRLDGIAAHLNTVGVSARAVVREGIVQTQVLAKAERNHADLICHPYFC
jgi:hypothetical protein